MTERRHYTIKRAGPEAPGDRRRTGREWSAGTPSAMGRNPEWQVATFSGREKAAGGDGPAGGPGFLTDLDVLYAGGAMPRGTGQGTRDAGREAHNQELIYGPTASDNGRNSAQPGAIPGRQTSSNADTGQNSAQSGTIPGRQTSSSADTGQNSAPPGPMTYQEAYSYTSTGRKNARRRKQRPRKKRRPNVFPVLVCIFLAVTAFLLMVKLVDRLGRARPENSATYGSWDYSYYEDGREDFKVDIDGAKIPGHGNGQEYIAIHFLGVEGENHTLEDNGVGTHFYIYYDGTIYQAADLDAVTWQVGTSGCYEQLHPRAGNDNTIGIELCVHCDGDPSDDRNGQWYFTEETQRAAVKLVRCLMRELDIPSDHILRHGDIVNKWCPAPYLENNRYNGSWTWDEFLQAVEDLPEDEVPDYPLVRES